MNCPYCHKEMRRGGIHPVKLSYQFWLPEEVSLYDLSMSTFRLQESITDHEGVILGEPMKFGLKYPKTLPVSYYCKDCNIIITPL